PGGFHLDEEEVRLAADKLHEVIEGRILVAQEPGSEVWLVPTRADLRHEQAEQPLAPVPDVIRWHGAPRLSFSVEPDRMIPQQHRVRRCPLPCLTAARACARGRARPGTAGAPPCRPPPRTPPGPAPPRASAGPAAPSA